MRNSIYHHGIKGMKWGVRRTPAQLGYKPAKKKISEMSDNELQQRINRMQKERQYKDMVKPNYVKAGERLVKGILIASGTEIVKEYVKNNMRSGLEALLEVPDIQFSYKD